MTKKEEKKRGQVRHVVLRTTSGTGCVGKKSQRKKKIAIKLLVRFSFKSAKLRRKQKRGKKSGKCCKIKQLRTVF
jgi:hypothetical protein